MKKRTRRTVNFLAFNLLFFSLYLNFIHKDNEAAPDPALVQNNHETYKASAVTPIVSSPPVEKSDATVKAVIN
jgi:hypothetical protein